MNVSRLLLLVVVLLTFPLGIAGAAGSGAYGPSHAIVHSAPGPGVLAAPPTAGPSSSAMPVHPAIICPVPPLTYTGVNGVLPPSPGLGNQVPCNKIGVDEVHATFNSPTAGSAERWSIPFHLPVDGSARAVNAYLQSTVGMIVKGDPFSEWKQSYVEAVFTPSGAPVSSYSESVHVFALHNFSVNSSCLAASMPIVWNDSFFCVTDDLGTATNASTTSFAPGDDITVAFAGSTASVLGLDVWVNDTTTPSLSVSYILNRTNTGSYAFEPFYSSSCVDSCLLQWAWPYGLGVGITNCPVAGSGFAQCDSYNDTTWSGTGPLEYGIPKFFQSGGYTGDYYYFAPESTSGVCNFNAPSGQVTFCYNQDSLGGTGFYPWFTYNGTQLDFGINWTWTTQNWGGAQTEMLSNGAQHDLIPFYVYATSNDSRGSFTPPGQSIGVTARLQDLGAARYAGVTYKVNGGIANALALTRTSGSLSDGNWTGTIPAGPNGWVNYTLNATNQAGAPVTTSTYHIQRGALPTFPLNVLSNLPQCGGVIINGTLYPNGTRASLLPGSYSIAAVGCYPYVFSTWTLAKGLTVVPFQGQVGTLVVTAAGTVKANFVYVRPFDSVKVLTNPSICGQVILNGTFNSSGTTVRLLDAGTYSLGDIGCAGFSFGGWTFTGGNFTILGTSITLHGNGTLTANFVSSTASFNIVFHYFPTGCPGGVLFQGAGYTDGQSLAVLAGSYAIAGDPCPHFGFLKFTLTSGLTVSGGTLTVSGSGTITETDFLLTEITFHTSPVFCGVIVFDGTSYHDGDVLVVPGNSTHTVTASSCPGYYLFSISGSGGVTVTGNVAVANASGDIFATSIAGTPTNFVAFLTDPSGCGTITFAGTSYTDGDYTNVATGSQATVGAIACNAYGFVEWVTFGGISIAGSTAYLNNSGAIEAIFRPLATLYLYTSPIGCGTVSVNNQTYPANSSIVLTEDKPYSLGATACAGYGFSNWVNSSGAEISGPWLKLSSGAVLTAIFTPVKYFVTVTVLPAVCGGVRLASQTVGNGTVLSLSGGSYSILPAPCVGNHLVRWDITGNLSVVNTTIWVNGSGTLRAVYQPVSPSVALFLETSTFAGLAVPVSAVIAVLVPPYNYSYAWDFGDNAKLTTPVNFTSHTYSTPGSYEVKLTVTDPYGRTANASATISVVPSSASNDSGLTTLSVAAIVGAILAVAVVLLVGPRLRRGPPESEPQGLPPPEAPSDASASPLFEPEVVEGPKP